MAGGTHLICIEPGPAQASAAPRRPVSAPFLAQLIAEREQLDVQRRRRRAPVDEALGAYRGRDRQIGPACDARL